MSFLAGVRVSKESGGRPAKFVLLGLTAVVAVSLVSIASVISPCLFTQAEGCWKAALRLDSLGRNPGLGVNTVDSGILSKLILPRREREELLRARWSLTASRLKPSELEADESAQDAVLERDIWHASLQPHETKVTTESADYRESSGGRVKHEGSDANQQSDNSKRRGEESHGVQGKMQGSLQLRFEVNVVPRDMSAEPGSGLSQTFYSRETGEDEDEQQTDGGASRDVARVAQEGIGLSGKLSRVIQPTPQETDPVSISPGLWSQKLTATFPALSPTHTSTSGIARNAAALRTAHPVSSSKSLREVQTPPLPLPNTTSTVKKFLPSQSLSRSGAPLPASEELNLSQIQSVESRKMQEQATSTSLIATVNPTPSPGHGTQSKTAQHPDSPPPSWGVLALATSAIATPPNYKLVSSSHAGAEVAAHPQQVKKAEDDLTDSLPTPSLISTALMGPEDRAFFEAVAASRGGVFTAASSPPPNGKASVINFLYKGEVQTVLPQSRVTPQIDQFHPEGPKVRPPLSKIPNCEECVKPAIPKMCYFAPGPLPNPSLYQRFVGQGKEKAREKFRWTEERLQNARKNLKDPFTSSQRKFRPPPPSVQIKVDAIFDLWERRPLGCGIWTRDCTREYLSGNRMALPSNGLPFSRRFLNNANLSAEAIEKIAMRFPDVKEGSFGNCAIVGVSIDILGSGRGREIDSHDTIFRFNSPLEGFRGDIGSKTDILFWKQRKLENVFGKAGTATVPSKFYFFTERAKFSMAANSKDKADFKFKGKPFLLGTGRSRETGRAAYNFYLRRLRFVKMTTGFDIIMTVLSSRLCKRVDLYGFSAQGNGKYFVDANLVQMSRKHMAGLEHWVYRRAMERGLGCVYNY